MLGVRQWRHGAFCVSRQHRLCRRWPRRIFSCIIHERLLYLFIVCETMFTIGEWRTISHANDTELQAQQWLQILAEEDCPLKLLWRTPIKIHRRAHRRRQPRSRENAKATSSRQRPQKCSKTATKYYNYTLNETNEERQHRLPTLPKAARLDQATLRDYSQNYVLRCSDRQQE